GSDSQRFYRFQITTRTQVTAQTTQDSVPLRELIINGANAQGQPSVGNIVGDAQAVRGAPQTTLSMELAPGTYYLWLAPASSGTGGDYTLDLSAMPLTGRHAPR